MLSIFTLYTSVLCATARKRHTLLAAVLLLTSSLANASPTLLTFDEALRLAAVASASAKASRASVAASSQAAARAAQLPDPMLKLGIDNLPVSGPDKFRPNADFMTMRRIGIEQQYFVLKALNGQAIGVSEMYSSNSGRDNGIASCKVNGPTTRIIDRTA